MLGPEGAGCGVAGCWAQSLIKNAQDLPKSERSQRIEQIKKVARESGCLNPQITNNI